MNIFLKKGAVSGERSNRILWIITLGLSMFFLNCGPMSTSQCMDGAGDKTINVSWNSSHSYDVNSVAGGGHKIYYDSASGVSLSTPSVINVPISSSSTTGSIANLHSACTYYFRVAAYSNLNPAGSGLSPESSIQIP